MSREILFKAKRLDNGEWVEGYCLKTNSYQYNRELHLIVPVGSRIFPHCEVEDLVEIDPKTLCQYTGVTDKSGKMIWENDIVDTFEKPSKEILRNVVKFIDGCFKAFKEHYLSIHLGAYEKTDLKVVGNIFDNPELLEVSE